MTQAPDPSMSIRLVRYRPEHWPLLHDWLCRPHVARWWGDPVEALASVTHHPQAEHALISANGRPVGYVCWRRLSAEEAGAADLTALPPDHVDVDILIGDPDLLGKGIGSVALSLVFDQLRLEGIPSVGVGTDGDNHRARRAFEKAGFKLTREFEEQGRPMCYYVRGQEMAV